MTDTTPTSDRTFAGSGDGERPGKTITLELTPEDLSLLIAAMQFCGTFGPSEGFQRKAMQMFTRLVALKFRAEMDGGS